MMAFSPADKAACADSHYYADAAEYSMPLHCFAAAMPLHGFRFLRHAFTFARVFAGSFFEPPSLPAFKQICYAIFFFFRLLFSAERQRLRQFFAVIFHYFSSDYFFTLRCYFR
jgi:hypothetical protein